MSEPTEVLNGYRVHPDRLFLRASRHGESYNGFRRKRVGAWNDADGKWTGIPICEECGGFFGVDPNAMGAGVSSVSTLELCEWRGRRVVIGRDKICVSSYRVVAVNHNVPAAFAARCGVEVIVARSGDIVCQGGGRCSPKSGATVTQSGGYCSPKSGAIVNWYGGECIPNPGAIINDLRQGDSDERAN